MWGTFLSEPLPIDGLVGLYPTNYLIGRMPIHKQRVFQISTMPQINIWGFRPHFYGLYPAYG